MCKEERHVLEEEMREIDDCDTEEFDTLDSSEKKIDISGDRWWPQAAKQEGDKTITGDHSKYLVGPTVHTKTYMLPYFY